MPRDKEVWLQYIPFAEEQSPTDVNSKESSRSVGPGVVTFVLVQDCIGEHHGHNLRNNSIIYCRRALLHLLR